jgi:hypothetical protein
MAGENLVRAFTWPRFGLFVLICLAVILGGCGEKKPPLSEQAQSLKKEWLGEMKTLTTALVELVAQQNWEAAKPILQTCHEEMEKKGKFVPLKIGLMDRNGILQLTYPAAESEGFDFYNFQPVKSVYVNKKIAQAKLYVGTDKIFILIGPLLQKDQVTGAVLMALSEEELQNKWKVSEKEFLNIDFNS